MNNIYDILEICLQELENGADLNAVLARYPDLANELRPILKASIMARTKAMPAPSPDVIRRGRSKLLQHASEMREVKSAPRKRMIPMFQRFAISLTLATVFLASGTGLVGASSSALPGENLYPVKRTWEDMRLFFTFNPEHKGLLESEFESERLNEVSELLTEGRHESIQYAGLFRQVNGVMYVSGVKVLVPDNLQVPADGAAVIIVGRTNAQRFVEIESIVLLPDGESVPVGEPVEELESGSNSGSGSKDGANSNSNSESNSNSGSGSEEGTGSGSGNVTQGSATSTPREVDPQSFEMSGTVESLSNNIIIVNGRTLYLENAKIDGVLRSGAGVEIKGYYASDGRFIVTELKVKNSGSDNGGSNEKSGSSSGSDSSSIDNSGSNSNDNSNSHEDSNSNEGGGGSSGGGENSNNNNNDH